MASYEQLTFFPNEPQKKKKAYEPLNMRVRETIPRVGPQSQGLSGLWSTLSGGGQLLSPALKQRFPKFTKNLMNPQFDYNFKTGVTGWGKNLGGVATGVTGAVQGIKAIKGINDLSDARDSSGDLQTDIINAAYGSPMLAYDLDQSQLALLNQLRRGNYNGDDISLDNIDPLGVLGDTAVGALSGLAGGLPGVIVGGVGGLANSIIGDLGNAQNQSNAELESLYQAVLDSERQYKDIKKQQAYARLMQY